MLSKINFDSKRVQGVLGVVFGLLLKWLEANAGLALPLVEVPGLGLQNVGDLWMVSGSVWGGVVGVGHAVVKTHQESKAASEAPAPVAPIVP